MRYGAVVVLILLATAIVPIQVRIDARGDHSVADTLMVRSGETLAKLLPGFEGVMADLYWLRAVQYYGGQSAFNEGSRFELLEPLITITTTLDPRFLFAYRYGAIFLAETWPVGAGRPDAAVQLLERGIDHNPDAWQLYWDLGYMRYLFLGDAEGGAATLLEGAKKPGGPEWLRSLAGRIQAESGNLATARAIWAQLYETTQGAMRDNARANLQYLDAVDVLDEYRNRLDAYRAQTGHWPASLHEVRGSSRPHLPLHDPSGSEFRYDATRGIVSLSTRSSLWWIQSDESKNRSKEGQ